MLFHTVRGVSCNYPSLVKTADGRGLETRQQRLFIPEPPKTVGNATRLAESCSIVWHFPSRARQTSPGTEIAGLLAAAMVGIASAERRNMTGDGRTAPSRSPCGSVSVCAREIRDEECNNFPLQGASQCAGCESRVPFADLRQTAGMGRLRLPAARVGEGGSPAFLWVRRRNLWGLLLQPPVGEPEWNLFDPPKRWMVGLTGAWDSLTWRFSESIGTPNHLAHLSRVAVSCASSLKRARGVGLGMPSDIIFPFQTCPHCISMQTLRACRRVHAIGAERLHTASGCRAYHAPYPSWR